jgi:ADP-ribose pyrophosphatase
MSKFEILARSTAYEGFFKVYKYLLRHALFGGGMSRVVEREVMDRGHAVGVLPYDAERDEVVLVEQFRAGAIDGPHGPWLIEIIAGMIEPGESPREVALREAREEAGCELMELMPAAHYYSSPGGSSEQVTLFLGRTSAAGVGGLHGLQDEDEDIRVHVMQLDRALGMVDAGVICSALPVIALQFLALNRERIRASWLAD